MTTTITISTNSLSDHTSRLYENESTTYIHVDGEESGKITIVREGKNTSTVTMTKAAVREFISDMDYQVEIAEDYYERSYHDQCKRALISIRKQIKMQAEVK